MAKGIAVVGPSGSGKSTSIENLDPKANFIINVASKPLPFRGWKKNYVKGKNIVNMIDGAQILALIQKISTEAPHIKSIVVEDAQYIMSDEFMRKANEVGFTKFTMIAKHLYDLASPSTMAGLRDDLTIFFLFHDEKSDDGGRKIKTIGKLLDEKITVEGLFTIVLFTKVTHDPKNGNTYTFQTQTDGNNTAKSPKGMFEDLYIPNDLKIVLDAVDKYENE